MLKSKKFDRKHFMSFNISMTKFSIRLWPWCIAVFYISSQQNISSFVILRKTEKKTVTISSSLVKFHRVIEMYFKLHWKHELYAQRRIKLNLIKETSSNANCHGMSAIRTKWMLFMRIFRLIFCENFPYHGMFVMEKMIASIPHPMQSHMIATYHSKSDTKTNKTKRIIVKLNASMDVRGSELENAVFHRCWL